MWISSCSRELAQGTLKDTYEKLDAGFPSEYHTPVPTLRRPNGNSDSIVEAHSLFPELMFHLFSAFQFLTRSEMPLSRREQELVHTLVSRLNSCHY